MLLSWSSEEEELIELTKINGEPMLVNSDQIEFIELIPESKVIMMNGRFHIVSEDKDIIIQKIIAYNQEIRKGYRMEA